MKTKSRLLLLSFAAILLFLCAPILPGCMDSGGFGSAAGPSVGAAAPDFIRTSLDGSSITLSDHQGRVVLLNFWASWCPPCRSEMPSMEKLHKTLGGDDFVIIAISIDGGNTSEVQDFITDNGYTFHTLHDQRQDVAKNYGIEAIPTTFIIDKNGTIVEISRGSEDWSSKKRLAQLRELMAE